VLLFIETSAKSPMSSCSSADSSQRAPAVVPPSKVRMEQNVWSRDERHKICHSTSSNVMSVLSLRWHFTNKSVTEAPYSTKSHILSHVFENDYDTG